MQEQSFKKKILGDAGSKLNAVKMVLSTIQAQPLPFLVASTGAVSKVKEGNWVTNGWAAC